MNTNGKTYTLIEVAKQLNRTKPVVYKMYHRGDFPNAAEVDGVVRVPGDDITAARQGMARAHVDELTRLGFIVQIIDKHSL